MNMMEPLLAAIADGAGAQSPAEIADLELLLSAGLITAAGDAGDIPAPSLLAAARSADPRSFVMAHVPASFFYWRLRQALPSYRQYAASGGWPTVPLGPKLEKGMSDPRVAPLGQRLRATGDLATPVSDPQLFDASISAALRRFQARHGLDPDGKLGAQTLAALNVSAEDRLASTLLNLERFRLLSARASAIFM